VQAASAFHWGG